MYIVDKFIHEHKHIPSEAEPSSQADCMSDSESEMLITSGGFSFFGLTYSTSESGEAARLPPTGRLPTSASKIAAFPSCELPLPLEPLPLPLLAGTTRLESGILSSALSSSDRSAPSSRLVAKHFVFVPVFLEGLLGLTGVEASRRAVEVAADVAATQRNVLALVIDSSSSKGYQWQSPSSYVTRIFPMPSSYLSTPPVNQDCLSSQ